MDFSVAIAIGTANFTFLGVLVAVLDFLKKNKRKINSTNEKNPNGYATRNDLRALEKRFDNFSQQINDKLDEGFQRIHGKIDEQDNKVSNQGERIARMEQAVGKSGEK